MSTSASAADVLQAGLTIESEEAIAIVQQLIEAFRSAACAAVVEPPFGPPTPERVLLCEDGSVVCRGCAATPAVSEIALLLQSLLPPAPARVPGGLRYTIARALLDVDVAPFDSLDELSETLARYERGPRGQIVIGLLRRFAASQALVPAAMVERRRHVRATELRRALREADARLYLQKTALQAVTVTPRPSRAWSLGALLACVAAGALLMVTGELMYHFHSDTVALAPAASPAVAAPADVAPPPATMPAVARTAASEDSSANQSARSAAVKPAAVRRPVRQNMTRQAGSTSKPAAAKRTTHPVPRVYPEPRPRRGDRDRVLDRLRFRWLREVFTKADL